MAGILQSSSSSDSSDSVWHEAPLALVLEGDCVEALLVIDAGFTELEAEESAGLLPRAVYNITHHYAIGQMLGLYFTLGKLFR